MIDLDQKAPWYRMIPSLLSAGLVIPAVAVALRWAPMEVTMGEAQRVLYVHVSVAWLSLLGFVVMAATSLAYLIRRDLRWDHWSLAAAELGWLCCSLTLVTGSLWAKAAWDTWWTWDPRLTTSFILWTIYSGCLIVRGSLSDSHQRARVAAVLAIVGMIDVPFVIMATRWFRTIHPVSPEMEPPMRFALMLCVVGFTGLFATLLVRRRSQLQLENLLKVFEQQPDF